MTEQRSTGEKGVPYNQIYPGMRINYTQNVLNCGCSVDKEVSIGFKGSCFVVIQELDFDKEKEKQYHMIQKHNWESSNWSM